MKNVLKKYRKSENVAKQREEVFIPALGVKGSVYERVARKTLVKLATGYVWIDDKDVLKGGLCVRGISF